MTRIALVTPPGADASIDGEDHTRGVAGAVGGEERHQVTDLARLCRAAERQTFLIVRVAVLVAELVLCPRLQQRDMAVGTNRPRIDADHADIVGQTLAPERTGE